MTESLVILSREELVEAVAEGVRRALDDRAETSPEWLTSTSAAELLGVHRKTVERLAKSGRLPVHRVGRLLRFRRSDVDAYLETEVAT